MNISVCIITRNESEYLKECLRALSKYPFEIVVVDTGSTDDSVNVAKKYTDKVYWSSINGLTIFKSTGNEVTFTARGRTVDYYYNHELASRESEKLVTIFESKWYKALQELKSKEKTTS